MKNKRKKFEKFLRGKNAWNEFVREIKVCTHPYFDDVTVESAFDGVYGGTIYYAFDWLGTIKGSDYWYDLDDEWLAICSRPSKLDKLTRR